MSPAFVRVAAFLRRAGFNINYLIAPGIAWRRGERLFVAKDR